jgi:uracil-DNA glycosylase family 4
MPDFLIPPRDLLSFYAEAGVDAAVGETPNDYLSAPSISPPASPLAGEARTNSAPTPTLPRKGGGSPAYAAPTAGPSSAPAVPEAAVMGAREAAKSAASLDELRTLLDEFNGCALKATASRLVFADGNPEGRVMFVGEAPGREEDIEGLPFVGRSGKLLDQMLTSIGLDRTKVYIANIVPWRPPGNRTPTPVETQICLPFIQRQIELADPDILVCVGGPSAGGLLNMQGILKNRGRWVSYQTGTREIRAMATLHPAYLLRSPIAKRLAWRDFLAIKKALG